MTSLNATVILIRLVVAFFLQRELTDLTGKAGYAKIGSLRNLSQILMSLTSFGTFNGIVKYVAQYKEDKEQLQRLFSTTFVFTILGSILCFLVLFFGSGRISEYFFYTREYEYIIKLVSVIVPFISIQRVFNGIVNGLSRYKKFAAIELTAYLLGAAFTLILLYNYNLDGALIAIAVIPLLQVIVMLFIFVKVLREYVQFRKLKFATPLAKQLLAFTVMSLASTVLMNLVEIDIRSVLANRLSESDAGIWTGMTTLSKNYMVFSSALFTLYVIPKFVGINTRYDFRKEVGVIYKTLLPLFAVGMVIIYFMRFLFIEYIFIDFDGMAPLFKWQLTGDFVRLATLVLIHQFIAKKLVWNFVFIELVSAALFFTLSRYLIADFGVEGVVIAHLIRYVVLFVVVLLLLFRYFRKNPDAQDDLIRESKNN